MDPSASKLDIELDRTAVLGDELLEQVRRLREADPIFWSERNQAWVVTGHAEVGELLKGDMPVLTARYHTQFASVIPLEERLKRIPYIMETVPDWVANVDDPKKHLRQRKLMMKAFSRSFVESQRDFVRQTINEAFASIEGRAEVELVEDVARPIPGRFILRLLGLSENHYPRLRVWAAAITGAFGSPARTPEALDFAEATLVEMRDLLRIEIAKRERKPGDDFISALVTAREQNDQLSENEILGILYLSLVAGHDSTMNSMCLGTAALARHPEARKYIRDHPERSTDIAMEISRYVAMSFMTGRTIAHDFEWRGHKLKQGQFMFVCVAGANRDPAAFTSPNTLDLSRDQTKNMTFGPGMHHCVGHLLAKMQLGEYLYALCDRFDPELVDNRLAFGDSFGFRGLESLRMRLHPRLTK